jgi:hypothetical protein
MVKEHSTPNVERSTFNRSAPSPRPSPIGSERVSAGRVRVGWCRSLMTVVKEPSTSNGERSTCKSISRDPIERWKLNVECWTLNFDCWTFAASFRRALPVVLLAVALFVSISSKAQTNEQRNLIVVVGASGEAEFGEHFSAWMDLWKQSALKGGLQLVVVGKDEDQSLDDRTRLLNALTNEVTKPDGELWLVFIGHGTFDGHTAKFNLRGPDISAEELAAVLKPCKRTLAVIECASASGPFINALSGPGRVVITATKSGYENNMARFGGYFAHAIGDPAADLDKDGQTSLLEAYLMASRQVEQFYKEEGRLATEHALLDDNGDGLGTPAEWFRGVRAVKTAANGKSVDGVRAHQLNLVRSQSEQELSPSARTRRDELEQQLSALRTHKGEMKETEYYNQLETVLAEIARLYQGK